MAHKLTVRNLHASYGVIRALHGITLDVHEGETVTLLGTNGNGKSTLMKCIAGLVIPTEGEIVLETDKGLVNLATMPAHDIVDLGIALVPEGRRLFPRLTVEENLILGAYRKQSRVRLARNLAHAFETFPILHERRRQLAGSMSGGQQQILAIARALMSDPRILLIDEPSVGLAPILVSQMIETIGELKKTRHLTVLMAEQNFNQAVRIADRGYLIVHGKIAFEGRSVSELKNNEVIKNCYLGA